LNAEPTRGNELIIHILNPLDVPRIQLMQFNSKKIDSL